MNRIPTPEFIKWCRTLSGDGIVTRAGRSTFTLLVEGDTLEFIPVSTKKPRRHSRKYVDVVLDHFAESGSFVTTHYRALTANSTYMLTLIDLYQKEKKGA
jgi:hypothetical protein